MLTLMMMISSLLLLPYLTKLYWSLIIMSLIIMSCLTSMLIPMMTYINISSMFASDSMSMTLVMLTMWVTSLMFLASYKYTHNNINPKMFSILCLILLMILTMCFTSSNLLYFYIWFEASLIPTMVLIMLWGYQPERIQASMYLMIYTVMASLPLLAMIVKIFMLSKTMNMTLCWIFQAPTNMPIILSWFMMIMAFMVKLPMFSVHMWLPKAHVEAPIAGSMILAAILLKLGGYGLMRMTWLFPNMNKVLMTPLTSIALIGASITSILCLRQTDLKSMIAYSSVGHMGLMMAGIMSNSLMGFYGGLTMMIAHGLSSSALFCMANITYEYTHTRSMALTKGLLMILPTMSLWWFLLMCTNMAAPPSINLLSEILLITATLSHSMYLIIPLALISFFTAAYSLFLYSSINHGIILSTLNSMAPMKSLYLTMLMMHASPLVMMILMPELVTTWC